MCTKGDKIERVRRKKKLDRVLTCRVVVRLNETVMSVRVHVG